MTKQNNLDQTRKEQTGSSRLDTRLDDTSATTKEFSPVTGKPRFRPEPAFLEADRNELYTRY